MKPQRLPADVKIDGALRPIVVRSQVPISAWNGSRCPVNLYVSWVAKTFALQS